MQVTLWNSSLAEPSVLYGASSGTAQKTHSFKAKLSSEGLGTHGFGSCRNEQPRDVGRSAFQTVLHNTQR